MKNLVTTLLFLSVFSIGTSFAQYPYLSFNTGFQSPLDNARLYNSFGASKQGSYAKAVPLSLGIGYMLEDHLGVELGLTTDLGVPVNLGMREAKSFQFRIEPMMTVITGTQALDFYAKFGVSIAPVTKIQMQELYSDGTLYQEDVKGFAGVGFKGVGGVSYEVATNIYMFAEVQSLNLAIKQKSSVKSGTSVGTTTYNKKMAPILPFNGVSTQLGVRIALAQ